MSTTVIKFILKLNIELENKEMYKTACIIELCI